MSKKIKNKEDIIHTNGSPPYISFVTPSRKRGGALIKSAKSLYETADDINSFEMLIGFDNDDEESANEFLDYCSENLKDLNFKVRFFERRGYGKLHEYTNSLCEMAEGEWLWLWNDDCQLNRLADDVMGWDTTLRKYKGDFRLIKVLSIQEPTFPLALFPLIPKQWFDLIGYFSLHAHNDIWLGVIAKNLDLMKIEPSFRIDHNRLPTETGMSRIATEYCAHTFYEDKYYEDNIKKCIGKLAKHLNIDKDLNSVSLK